MFGDNFRVGTRYFKQAKANELLVSSRFFTLQGEGPYRGLPAYFIRLSKCNLACSFCDTDFEYGEWHSFESLLLESETIINDFFLTRGLPVPAWAQNNPKKIVLVITGGEPSLQQQVEEFLRVASDRFVNLQIESNGTLLMPSIPQSVTLVVSPKCLEKNRQSIRYLEPKKNVLERADCLKFVMSAPNNQHYMSYSTIPLWAHQWAQDTNKPVYISPMNCYLKKPHLDNKNTPNMSIAERSEIRERISFWEPGLLDLRQNQLNHEYAAEYCMKNGFIFNVQLHLLANLP